MNETNTMKASTLFAVLALLLTVPLQGQDIVYTDAATLTLYGKPHTSGPRFHRVDTARYNDMPAPVKHLSTHAAGLVIAFKTNSNEIHAQWRVKEPVRFANNMTPLGKQGLDLYIKRNGEWLFAGVARPRDGASSKYRIVRNMADGEKECLLFLPLYDELVDLEIGVTEGSTISPLEVPWKGKIVIYGSSITQGNSASRPGLAYPARLARSLEYEIVNLGFSGNGKMEASVGRMIADIEDVDLFVLDCAANPSPEEIAERTEDLVRQVRAQNPEVPILMIESVIREGGTFDQRIRERVHNQNKNFRDAYTRLVADGMKQLHIVHGDDLLGHDHEGTVDGTHPNDIGFDRMLKTIEPKIRKILGLKRAKSK